MPRSSFRWRLGIAILLAWSSYALATQSSLVDQFYGSYSESLPIVVPRYHALEPHLDLYYSSAIRNDLLGVGWTLKGFSQIERATQTKGAPRYDTSDLYYLDGMELVSCAPQIQSASCATGGTHTTQIESYTRISYDPTGNSGAGVWTLWYKDGTKRVYGPIQTTTNNTGANRQTFKWGLTHVSDPHSNDVEYQWWSDPVDGTPYPAQILYDDVKVSIDREPREDRVAAATGRSITTTRFRLHSISIIVNGSPARVYVMFYRQVVVPKPSTAPFVPKSVPPPGGEPHPALPAPKSPILKLPAPAAQLSLLERVVLYGSDVTIGADGKPHGTAQVLMEVRKRTEGNHGTFDQPVVKQLSTQYMPDLTFKIVVGDFDGNGSTDVMRSYMSDTRPFFYTSIGAGWYTEVALSTGDGSFRTPVTQWHSSAEWPAAWRLVTGDFNGDGRTDVAAVYNYQYGWRAHILLSKGDGTFADPVVQQLNDGAYDGPWTVLADDFNGDGLTDLCISFADGFGWRSIVALAHADGTFSAGALQWHDTQGMTQGWKLLSADVNGDGRADLVASAATTNKGWQTKVVINRGDGTMLRPALTQVQVAIGQQTWGDFNGGDWDTIAGDFNGDGKRDLAVVRTSRYSTDLTTYIALSLGNGFFAAPSQCVLPGKYVFDIDKHRPADVFAIDVNGDGFSDIVRSIWFVQSWRADVILTRGDGQCEKARTTEFSAQPWFYTGQAFAGDFNGDGRADLLASVPAQPSYSGSGWASLVALSSGSPYYLVTQVRNTLGGDSTVSYVPSSRWENTNNPPIVQTAAALDISDGRQNTTHSEYTYAGGLFDGVERRFLGFHYVKRVLPKLSTESAPPSEETWFHQDYGSVTKPSGSVRKDGAGKVLSASIMTYANNGASVPYQSLEVADWLFVYSGGQSKLSGVIREFDSTEGGTWNAGYGNVVREIIVGDYQRTDDDLCIRTQYFPNTERFIVDRPARIEVRIGLDCTGGLKKATRFIYDSNATWDMAPLTGELRQRERWRDTDNKYVGMTWGYDARGNIKKETDAVGTVTSYGYDTPFARHLTSVEKRERRTGALHRTMWNWDSGCDTVSSTTDVNNQSTWYVRDPLCRLTESHSPGGMFEIRTYYDQGLPPTQRIRIEIPGFRSGQRQWTETYLDGLGRVWRTARRGPATQSIYVDRTFNERGLLDSETRSYYVGQPVYSAKWSYDALDRMTAVTMPDGSSRKRAYGLLSVKEEDELGHVSGFDVDVQGRISALWRDHVEADGSVSRYTTRLAYWPTGELREVVDHKNNKWTYSYDSLSQIRDASDPDRGRTTWVYDDTGRLALQTDALGQQLSYDYDDFGRTVTKTLRAATFSGSTVQWHFDEARPGYFNLDRLTSIKDGDGGAIYNYDAAGRLVSGQRTTLGRTYGFTKGYDVAGRLLWTRYPDGDLVGTPAAPLEYDDAGRLRKVPGVVELAVYGPDDALRAYLNANRTLVFRCGVASRGWLAHVKTYAVPQSIANLIANGGIGLQNACITMPGQLSGLSAPIQDLIYHRNVEGRVRKVQSSLTADLRSYDYDDLHRLVAGIIGGSVSFSYRYDELGNIMFASNFGDYSYASPKPHAVTKVGTTVYGYDALGNRTSLGNHHADYDVENRLTKLDAATFRYDANGIRIRRVEGTAATDYVGAEYESTGGTSTKYVSIGGILVAKRQAGAWTWLHTDQLGSVHSATDAGGVVVHRLGYTPYGSPIGPVGGESRTYVGQRVDATGLYYLHARYYDAAIGSFTTPEPTVPTNVARGMTPYTYCNGDPINCADADGLGFFSDLRDALADAMHWVEGKTSHVPVIGGILTIGFRADPLYGFVTGDWGGWSRAFAATSIIVGAALLTYATGGLAATNPFLYVVLSASIGFASSASVASIYGANSDQAIRAGMIGAAFAAGGATLNVAYQALQGPAPLSPSGAMSERAPNVIGASQDVGFPPDFKPAAEADPTIFAKWWSDHGNSAFVEGGSLSNALAKIPAIKATGWLHDFINAGNAGPGIPTMIPAFAWTSGAYLGEMGFAQAIGAGVGLGVLPGQAAQYRIAALGASQQAMLSSATGQATAWMLGPDAIEARFRLYWRGGTER